MDPKAQRSTLLTLFQIGDRDSCVKAIRNGGIVALVSGGLSAVLGIAGFLIEAPHSALRPLLDPWNLVDAGIVLLLAALVLRKSRVAAALLVLHFVMAKVIMWRAAGRPTGFILTVLIFLFYVTALRGTLLWHTRYRHADEELSIPEA
jgi:hypothetical protein